MRVSLVFPLICVLVMRSPVWLSLPMAALISCCATYFLVGTSSANVPLLNTLHFASLFVVGILLARKRQKLACWASGLTTRSALSILVVAILAFAYGDVFVRGMAAVLFHMHHTYLLDVADWPSVVGAAVIISLSLGVGCLRRTLHKQPFQSLGRISYSVYLLHSTVLFTLLHLFGKTVPMLVLLAVYIPTVMILSTLMYEYVEKPSMAFGRSLSNKFKWPISISA